MFTGILHLPGQWSWLENVSRAAAESQSVTATTQCILARMELNGYPDQNTKRFLFTPWSTVKGNLLTHRGWMVKILQCQTCLTLWSYHYNWSKRCLKKNAAAVHRKLTQLIGVDLLKANKCSLCKELALLRGI